MIPGMNLYLLQIQLHLSMLANHLNLLLEDNDLHNLLKNSFIKLVYMFTWFFPKGSTMNIRYYKYFHIFFNLVNIYYLLINDFTTLLTILPLAVGYFSFTKERISFIFFIEIEPLLAEYVVITFLVSFSISSSVGCFGVYL